MSGVHTLRQTHKEAKRTRLPLDNGNDRPQETKAHGGAKKVGPGDLVVPKKYRPFGSTPPDEYPNTPTPEAAEMTAGKEGKGGHRANHTPMRKKGP